MPILILKARLIALLLPSFLGIYLGAQHYEWRTPVPVPRLDLEHSIPFVPGAIWIYLSTYLFVPGVFLQSRTREVVHRFAAAYGICLLGAGVVFWSFPTALPREGLPIASVSGLTRQAFELLWRWDAPTNCVPSLHVAFSCVAGLAWAQDRNSSRHDQPGRLGGVGSLGLVWAALISVSTVLVRQHALLDVTAGLTLGALAWVLAAALLSKRLT